MATTTIGIAHHRCDGDGSRTLPGSAGAVGGYHCSCVSITEVTIRMAWIAGLAVAALVLAGWRKPARAQPKSHAPLRHAAPGALPGADGPGAALPPAGLMRRVWAVIASGGLRWSSGRSSPRSSAFGVAVVVTT